MESDKENKQKKTRIPVPLDPLPQLPSHLLKTEIRSPGRKRGPLKTINVIPGTSKIEKTPIKPHGTPLVLDTRHVTLRGNTSNLDWSLKILRNQEPREEAKPKKSDEQVNQDNGKDIRKHTPVHVLEPNRVRNIKRSLKRPHSRELQGRLSPGGDTRKGDSVKRQLDFTDVPRSPVCALQRSVANYTMDIFQHLLMTEKLIERFNTIPSMTRACVINWLMKVNDDLSKRQRIADSSPVVIQTACWLLDSYLGMEAVTLESLQLVAAACYWIAQKLQGRPLTASKVVTYSRNAFSIHRLLMTERSVLTVLKCPRTPVVPQDYIGYFSWWCDEENVEETELAATFICTSTLLLNNVLHYEYASVLGAAAVKTALVLLKKKDQMTLLNRSQVYNWAKEKTTNLQHITSMMRKAVRKVSFSLFEYRTPFEQYNAPPLYIAQRIVSAAVKFSRKDDQTE